MMPATAFSSRTAKDSMGTGCTSENRYTLMPLKERTFAAARANTSELRRVSYEMTTPRSACFLPSDKMYSASPCVALRTV